MSAHPKPEWLRELLAEGRLSPNDGRMLADALEIADESAWCHIESKTLQRGPEWRDLSTIDDPHLPAVTNRRIQESIAQAVRYLGARGLLERHAEKPNLVRFRERPE